MPVIVPSERLEIGMRLAEPIVEAGRVMVAGGREMTPDSVALLQRRFPNRELRVMDEVIDPRVQFGDDRSDRDLANEMQHRIRVILEALRNRCGPQLDLGWVNFRTLQAQVGDIYYDLCVRGLTYIIPQPRTHTTDYWLEHASNVFTLSLLLGHAAREYVARERNRQSVARMLQDKHTADFTPLGIGAMLADLGMIGHEDLYDQHGRLPDAQLAVIRAHPKRGAGALPENFSPLARMIIRTHHENADATGYPEGLGAEEQHIFTRVVRIADAFETATARHVFREARSPVRVLWEMTQGPAQRHYDSELIRVFNSVCQPFPIGSKLHLVDGRVAVVTRYNRQDAFAPHVIVAFDHEGRHLPEDRIEGPVTVGQRRSLRIEWFEGESMDYLYRRTTQAEKPQQGHRGPRQFFSLYESSFP